MAEDPSLFSASTLHNSQTARSKETNASSRSRRSIVLFTTAWAKDEPPSPTDSHPAPPSPGGSRVLSEARREHRWFPFTRRRPPLASEVSSGSSSTNRLEKKPAAHLSGLPDEGICAPVLGESSPEQPRSRARDWGLRITMPTPPVTPQALARTRTPGWDSPSLSRRDIYEQLRNGESVEGQPPDSPVANESWWPRTRKRARAYLLTNTYVPLLFRFVNITFTTAALAIAIRIRRDEARNDVTGVLGSSPTLVVIFAPLTLVHVMVAIYLEYFGRPLGLWRTSAKLAHTLLEVLSICAWSAALSLCFDNFFTSPIPCAGPSEISWYSDIPRPPSPFGNNKGSAGEALCDSQVALICLVGIGLLMYCFNLVISLYRIFEKVKYHHPSVWGGSSTRV
ncbi:hypothetical protein H4582DRAFT_2108951 [Lactarius indigo]|nr:hypothetical protein H4582DRAFT_2108951 [Lactarius indigo]